MFYSCEIPLLPNFYSRCWKASGRIVSASTPGMAPCDAAKPFGKAANDTVLFNCLDHVTAARRTKSTVGTDQGTQSLLIQANHRNQDQPWNSNDESKHPDHDARR